MSVLSFFVSLGRACAAKTSIKKLPSGVFIINRHGVVYRVRVRTHCVYPYGLIKMLDAFSTSYNICKLCYIGLCTLCSSLIGLLLPFKTHYL